MKRRNVLLPRHALAGVRLGVSVSESPDLARLGLTERHFRLAVGEIARSVLVLGGHLAYGGHLRPEGYTAFLLHELERYGRRDQPLHICLPWPEHRKLALSTIEEERRSLGLLSELICVGLEGTAVDPATDRGETAVPAAEDATTKGLTSARRYMARHTNSRLFIGGKRHGFMGDMPGLLEEAIFAVQERQPIYLAGGFGGIAFDIAKGLSIDEHAWFPDFPNPPAPQHGTLQGLELLKEAMGATNSQSLDNGLSPEENRLLAVSYRPSEIATLVSVALGRKFRQQPDANS